MLEEVYEVIADTINCDVSTLTPAASLQDDLGIDSLDAVEINMALEDKFGISISDEELMALKTVEDIVNTVAEKTK